MTSSCIPSLCNLFEDRATVHEINGCPIFNWIAVTWLKIYIGHQDSSPSNVRQGDIPHYHYGVGRCALYILWTYHNMPVPNPNWKIAGRFPECLIPAMVSPVSGVASDDKVGIMTMFGFQCIFFLFNSSMIFARPLMTAYIVFQHIDLWNLQRKHPAAYALY